MRIKRIASTICAATLFAACAYSGARSNVNVLSENETLNLIENPEKWDNKTVKLKIFPYDNGYQESYVVCFERCDKAAADKSIFLIYTKANRFRGYRGDQPVIVNVRYSSACFYKRIVCPEMRFGLFTEINGKSVHR